MSATSTQRLLVAILVLFVLACVAVGFYFIGRSAADAEGAEQRGYSDGRDAALANFQPGAGGYERIHRVGYREGRSAGLQAGLRRGTRRGERVGQREGQAQGERVGEERGQREGEQQGEREGEAAGAHAALGNFSSWDDGSFYVVRMGQGPSDDVPFAVQSRVLMAPADAYHICVSQPNQICRAPLESGG